LLKSRIRSRQYWSVCSQINLQGRGFSPHGKYIPSIKQEDEMTKEHDRVVLTEDRSDQDLQAGDVGTVVHVYADETAYEVEFFRLDGETVAVETVSASAVRPVASTDVTHARTRT
jgi:hypothetical protein